MTDQYRLDPTQDYLGPPSFTLEPRRTALIVVDMQYASACRTEGLGKKLAAEGRAEVARWRFDRVEQVVVPHIQQLLAFFRRHHLPIIYLTVGSRKPDFSDAPPHQAEFFRSLDNREGSRTHEVLDELKPRPGERVINKTTTGAFASTNLAEVLRQMGVTCLVFTGVSTNMCVDTTARTASDLGYWCVLAEDACGAAKEEYHRAACITWQRGFGRLASTDEVIAEMKQALTAAAHRG